METYTLNEHYDDPSAARLSGYFSRLFMLVSGRSFLVAVLDTERGTFVRLAHYRLKTLPRNEENHRQSLLTVLEDQEWLRQSHSSVVIGIDSPFHTLVPSGLYDPDRIAGYIGFNFRTPESTASVADPIPELGAFNVYALPSTLHELFTRQFPGSRIVHASTSLLRVLDYHYRSQGKNETVFLNLRDQEMDLAVFGREGLVFFNSFPSRGREDVLYFTLYSLEQAGMSPSKSNILVMSAPGEEKAASEILEPFVDRVDTPERVGPMNYSPFFYSLPSAGFQSLFGLALCGS
jgi:hypothetical protein